MALLFFQQLVIFHLEDPNEVLQVEYHCNFSKMLPILDYLYGALPIDRESVKMFKVQIKLKTCLCH